MRILDRTENVWEWIMERKMYWNECNDRMRNDDIIKTLETTNLKVAGKPENMLEGQ